MGFIIIILVSTYRYDIIQSQRSAENNSQAAQTFSFSLLLASKMII